MASAAQRLDLSSLPPIFILPTHLSTDELHIYEDHVYSANGELTYKASEARVFLGRINQKKRALFDLRALRVYIDPDDPPNIPDPDDGISESRGRKRKQPDDEAGSSSDESLRSPVTTSWPDLASHALVIKLDWLDACLKYRKELPYQPQIIFGGKITAKPSEPNTPPQSKDTGIVTYIKASPSTTSAPQHTPGQPPAPRPFGSHHIRTSTKRPPPRLQHGQTTADSSSSRSTSPRKKTLPPPPSWTDDPHSTYSCCRSTPLHAINASFIAQLSQIKLSRILTLDQIGIRAYSTSIASLSAYPHPIVSETEIMRLPGCNNRIADLWREWHDSSSDDDSRTLGDVRRFDNDAEMQVLRTFYEIWGVGADTARKLYYTHHLRDLDDVVEYHWSQLNRVQQIGVKFYTEFQEKIPRKEVEDIAATILKHARLCKGIPEADWSPSDDGTSPNDMVCVIVGGYRRGKTESGDVDVILSHRDSHMTHDLVVDVVQSLEAEGWITHTLTLQTTTSDRDQQTLPYRGEGHGGHGFDSLDKALCVWQDPNFDDEGGTVTKNPNVHRRVDIILSPWRTVGCAVLGWSGGTTFQRDIRRFAAKVKGWKFDSSGVRDRGTGAVVDLEGEGGTWEEREKKVMEGLGIGYRSAEERCTG